MTPRTHEQKVRHMQIFKEYLGDSLEKINAILQEHCEPYRQRDLLDYVASDNKFEFVFEPRFIAITLKPNEDYRNLLDTTMGLFAGLEGCEVSPVFETFYIVPACGVRFPAWGAIEAIVERRRLAQATPAKPHDDGDPDGDGADTQHPFF